MIINRNILPVQKCLSGDDIKNLADYEIIAIIVGSGTKQFSVMELSMHLISTYGGLPGILKAGLRELSKIPGIGLKKAIRIHAALEIGRRIIQSHNPSDHLDSPKKVWKYLLPIIVGLNHEEFYLLVLNNKSCLIKKVLVSLGTVSEAIIHPREVFREAIRECGSSIIIAHNHPSGNLHPSKDDILTTRRIRDAGRIIGIQLLDHIIITEYGFMSMKEEGFL